jgi:hypothetical protein
MIGTTERKRTDVRPASTPLETSNRVRLLYIGGYTRSGSTMLNRLLATVDDHLAVGEVWHIWRVGLHENQLCGCGQPIRSCPFWTAVFERAFGGLEHVDTDKMLALWRSVQDRKYLPYLVFPHLRPPAYQRRLHRYQRIVGSLYRAIAEESGSSLIVDSSKLASYAFILSEIDDLEIDGIQLVRDSRATAHSWKRKKLRPEVHWKPTYMERYGLTKSAFEWNSMHILLDLAMRRFERRVLLRYEDLTATPEWAVSELASALGADWGAPPWDKSGRAIEFGIDHTIGGNPNRFTGGKVEIRTDDEWREQMPRWQQAAVSAMTLPVLARYGYLTH